jgi:hypothetical protein
MADESRVRKGPKRKPAHASELQLPNSAGDHIRSPPHAFKSQILRKDLENQGQVVQETVVSVVEFGPSTGAPWDTHPVICSCPIAQPAPSR